MLLQCSYVTSQASGGESGAIDSMGRQAGCRVEKDKLGLPGIFAMSTDDLSQATASLPPSRSHTKSSFDQL